MSDVLVQTQVTTRDYDLSGGHFNSDELNNLFELPVEYQSPNEAHPSATFEGPIDILSDFRKLRDERRNPDVIEYLTNNIRTELFEAITPYKRSEIVMNAVKEGGEVIDLEMGGYSVSEMLINGIAHEEQSLIDQGLDIEKSFEELTREEYAKMFELRRRRQEYINLQFMLSRFSNLEEGRPFIEISPYPQGVDHQISKPYGYSDNNAVMRVYRLEGGKVICEQVKLPTDYDAFYEFSCEQEFDTEGKDKIESQLRDGTDLLAKSGFVTKSTAEGGVYSLEELLELYFDGRDELGNRNLEDFYREADDLADIKIPRLINQMRDINSRYDLDDPATKDDLVHEIVRTKIRFWLDFVKRLKDNEQFALQVGIETEDGMIPFLVENVDDMSFCGGNVTSDRISTEILNPGLGVMRLLGVVSGDMEDSKGAKVANCPACGMMIFRGSLMDGVLVSSCKNPQCQSDAIGCAEGEQFSWEQLRRKYQIKDMD